MEPSTIVVLIVLLLVTVALLAVVVRMRREVSVLSSRLDDVRRDADDRVRAAREQAQAETARRHRVERAATGARAETAGPGASVDPREGESDQPATVITRIGDDEDADQVRTTRVVSAALGGPIIKAASLAHGIRYALDDEARIRIRAAAKRELKRQRKARRRTRRRTPVDGHASGPSVQGPTGRNPWTGGWTR